MQNVKFVEKPGGIGAQENQVLNLVCCVPGSTFSSPFLKHWTAFIIQCFMNNINVMLSNAEDAVIYYVRNKCLGGDVLRGVKQKPFNGKVKYDYMLWIDSDIIFTFQHFIALLKRNLPVIAGMYQTSDGYTYPAVREWDEKFFLENGYFQFLNDDDIKDMKDPIEVVYTGFGFLLAKNGIFESLEYPWFEPIHHSLSETVKDFSSEDVSVCRKLLDKGHKIYVDPTVVVGHLKPKIIMPQRLVGLQSPQK